MIAYCKNRVVADKVMLADSFISRFKGLMGKKSLGDGEGLLLMNCPSIHCFFMKITIDAIYISKDMTVLGIETLAPWSIGSRVKNTAHVLEIPAAKVWVTVGDVLEIVNHE